MPAALAGSVVLPGGGGGQFSLQVASYKEARFHHVIEQQYDFSCGSAAVAGLLTYHYDDPVSEEEVLREMFASGDQEQIRTKGFSLLDMKKYLEGRGYQADGYRLTLDRLDSLGVAPIVLINHDGYLHFVVVKGVSDREVLLGDPAKGIWAVSKGGFESMWNGIFFLIRNKADIAKQRFNAAGDWRARVTAPLGEAISRQGLASFSLSLPYPGQF